MRFGIVILPEYRWSEAAPRWRAAEQLGFDKAWTYDHLSWHALQDSPWYGTVPTLTAAALVTTRIRLGTFVTSPNFRHPLTLTRELLALDDISGGRFDCGIGSGGGIDSRILGGPEMSPRQLVDRLTEFVVLLDRLLTTDRVDHSGEYFSTRNGRTVPGCVQRPRVPFVIAASGPRSQALAAEYGAGWVTTGRRGPGSPAQEMDEWFAKSASLNRRMDEILQERGREPGEVDRHLLLDTSPRYSLTSVAAFEEMTGRAAEAGFTDVIAHWPRADGVYAGTVDVLESVAAEVMPRWRTVS
ncbi:MAG TPA: LLM class flavin-dependent oxidoreductase [Kribbellaceae bacterium]|nr:LLM class flavin-dependent oxidoreductase [Kribbellaceae bacterium]